MSRRFMLPDERKALEAKCFSLFKGMDIKRFVQSLQAMMARIGPEIGFFDYFSRGAGDIEEELRNDKEVLSRLKGIEEREKNLIIAILAKSLTIAAAKMNPRGEMFIKKMSGKMTMGEDPYFVEPDKLAEYFVKEYRK